jgi:hypothetical protein
MTTDDGIERVARRLADEVIANRITRFTSADPDVRRRIVSRVRAILSGRTSEDPPD